MVTGKKKSRPKYVVQINKDVLLFNLQANINAYEGRYGEVRPVFDSVEKIEVSYVQCEIGTLGQEKYIVIPGSLELRDWIDDFRRRHVQIHCFYDNITVHKGFLKQYEIIKSCLFDKIQNLDKINLTGFSMGAAISTIAALDIKLNFPNMVVSHMNYGSPRVGNIGFAEKYNELLPEMIRVVNGRDIVTKVPVVDYVHVGRELLIGQASGIGSRLLAHNPERYLEELERVIVVE